MRSFIGVLRTRFFRDLQYRSVFFYGMLTQIAFGVIICMTRMAFYNSAGGDASMTLPQIMSYSWIGQATLRMQAWDGDGEVNAMIRNGDVAYELMRPMSLVRYWYARAMAQRLVPVVLILLPQILIAAFLMPSDIALTIPGVAACTAFLITIGGAVALSAALTIIMSVSLLFTISGEGISRFMPAFSIFLSGSAVPLAMFPLWAQPIVTVTPFAYLYDMPARIFVGMLPPESALSVLAAQLAWTAVILLLALVMQNAGLKRLRIQGG